MTIFEIVCEISYYEHICVYMLIYLDVQMIFVHCVMFQTVVREDASVLLVDYSTITPVFI